MLFQFRCLTCKNIDTSFLNIYRHYASAVHFRAKEKKGKQEVTRRKNGIPIIVCKKQMYDFYKGDTYNKKISELASHGWKNRTTKGDFFFIYPYENKNERKDESNCKTFEDLCPDSVLRSNLEALDINEPLEIQQLGIPKILDGHNALLAAETGCGKTLAYLLPMIMKILKWKQIAERNINTPLGLIVTPSRELTVQIGLELIKLSKNLDIKTKIITGGRTKRLILDPPTGQVDILVCSFGVISKLTTFGVYNLKFVRYVVLDEADSLFHETFEAKLRIFMQRLDIGYHQTISESEFPVSAQLVLASATVPSRLESALGGTVNISSVKEIATKKLHTILVPQKFIRLIPSQKPVELLKYIKSKISKNQRIIIFSNRNTTAHWVFAFLSECGIKVTSLNGDMPLKVRRGKYGEFLNGKTMVLSTTNGGSRGLDTIMVNHILNYDFPLNTADYIHRCGRTGRIGTVGESRVTSFISRAGEVAVVQKIEKAARRMGPVPIFNILESAAGEEAEEGMLMEDDYSEEMIEDLDKIENVPY